MKPDDRFRTHPELGVIIGLGALLEVLPQALIAVHASGPAGPLQDQARSILGVSRVLEDQVSAYVGLVEVEQLRAKTRRTRAS